MTYLAAQQQDPGQLDLLELVADTVTPLGSLAWDDFVAACRVDADAHDGWVNPNRVSRILRQRLGEFDPRSFSAKWAPACGTGRKAFLDKSDRMVPIDAAVSRGNGDKAVRLRRWRGWDLPPPAAP